MEWIAALQGKVVGLDTTPLIYFIEENPAYLKTVHPFFEAMDHGEFSVVTSIVTLLEVRKDYYERQKDFREPPLLDCRIAPAGLHQRVWWSTDRSASHTTTDPRPYGTTGRADRDASANGYCCARGDGRTTRRLAAIEL